MPVNKNAVRRFQIIDSLLRKQSLSFNELLEELNETLAGENLSTVSRSMLEKDLAFMRKPKPQGLGAPIGLERDQSTYPRAKYRLIDKNYRFSELDVTDQDARALRYAALMLSNMTHVPSGKQLAEALAKLGGFDLAERNNVIHFEPTETVAGLQNFDIIFEAVTNKLPLSVYFKEFRMTHTEQFYFHPYLIKAWRGRWYVFGRREDIASPQQPYVLALDRIVKLVIISNIPFIENTLFDPNTYFDDFIGVTKFSHEPVRDIEIKVSVLQSRYLESKPIHKSMTFIKMSADNQFVHYGLKVRHNYELLSELARLGGACQIVKPAETIKAMQKFLTEGYE